MISLKQIGCITENTLNWYIVRRPGHDLPPLEYTHVPELSPSNDLLEFYLDHLRNGTWNYEVFFNSYRQHRTKLVLKMRRQIFSSDCIEIPQAYYRMSRDFCAR